MESKLSDDIFITVESTVEASSFPAYHSHNVYEIYILVSGIRNMFIGNDLYTVEAGDATLLKPYIPHRSYGKTPYKGICIEFSEKYLTENYTHSEQIKIKQCFSVPIISVKTDSLELLWNGACDITTGNLEKKKYLLMLIQMLFNRMSVTTPELKRSFDSDLSPIGTYMQEHYKDIKSLDELTERFGISKSYICRLFKKQTGMTIIEYINRLKIQYAYQLLQETDIPINEISVQSGFKTVIYFNRIFKKIVGDTPKNARKIAKTKWTYIR